MKLRSLLTYNQTASVNDPCVGQGAALHLVSSDATVRRYGIELDAGCARIAGASGIETIQANSLIWPNCRLWAEVSPPLAPRNRLAFRKANWARLRNEVEPIIQD